MKYSKGGDALQERERKNNPQNQGRRENQLQDVDNYPGNPEIYGKPFKIL